MLQAADNQNSAAEHMMPHKAERELKCTQPKLCCNCCKSADPMTQCCDDHIRRRWAHRVSAQATGKQHRCWCWNQLLSANNKQPSGQQQAGVHRRHALAMEPTDRCAEGVGFLPAHAIPVCTSRHHKCTAWLSVLAQLPRAASSSLLSYQQGGSMFCHCPS